MYIFMHSCMETFAINHAHHLDTPLQQHIYTLLTHDPGQLWGAQPLTIMHAWKHFHAFLNAQLHTLIESNAYLKAIMSGIILCDVVPMKCIRQRAVRLCITIFNVNIYSTVYNIV